MNFNTEKLKFQFTENYQEVINNSSIVRDFDKFIEMAINGQLELSKTGVLNAPSARLVNETITRKIPMLMNRPLIKSFPNVLALFILFSVSGLSKKELKGKKKLLKVNDKMHEQWKQFTDIDKYFYLLSLTFTNFNFEPINERKGNFEFSIVTRQLADIKGKWTPEKPESEYILTKYSYKTIFMLLDMLNLIDIKDAPPIEKQGWIIKSIQPQSFMKGNWDINNLVVSSCMYGTEESDNEIENDEYSFTEEDIEEVGIMMRFADKISEVIPEFTKRLKQSIENKSGTYIFKAKLGRASRTIKIDYRHSLDNLCTEVLDAFDFDYDHLYDITFKTSLGYSLTFSGAPDMSYAEYPTTENISIGKLPIQLNDEMKFTYDYGDNWEFSIILEKVESIKNETKEIPIIETIDSKGEAPKQYPDWG